MEHFIGPAIQVILTVAPMLCFSGMIWEKVRRIERQLGGNGGSVPERCHIHERRLEVVEKALEIAQNAIVTLNVHAENKPGKASP